MNTTAEKRQSRHHPAPPSTTTHTQHQTLTSKNDRKHHFYHNQLCNGFSKRIRISVVTWPLRFYVCSREALRLKKRNWQIKFLSKFAWGRGGLAIGNWPGARLRLGDGCDGGCWEEQRPQVRLKKSGPQS